MEHVAGAAGATLGYIVGDVPGAVSGYKYGQKAYKFFNEKKLSDHISGMKRRHGLITPTRTPKRVKLTTGNKKTQTKKSYLKSKKKRVIKKARKAKANPFGGVSSSAYAGKFSAPVKVIRDAETKCGKLGYHLTNEQFGEVADANCVYLYHSNFCIDEIATVIQAALIRSLFRKAGIEIENELTEIPFSYADLSSGFRIVYSKRDKITGVIGTVNYDSSDNISFKQLNLSLWSNIGAHFRDYMENVNSDQEPYMIGLYGYDEGALLTHYRLVSNLVLQNEKVELHMSSSLTVQNRTLGASSSTDFNADRVDNQPLVGYLYEFKNGDPRLRANQIKMATSGALNAYENYYATGDRRGIRSFGGTQLGQDMQEPPVPQLWKNCAGAAKVNLDPGFIKKCSISTVLKNRLPELLKRLRVDKMQIANGIHGYTQLSACKSQIVCLEEGLRTATTNLITVLFERESKIGAFSMSKKVKGIFRTRFQSETINPSVIVEP
jgi:hypothetical protein